MTCSGCLPPWPGRPNPVSWPGRRRRVRRSSFSPPRLASRPGRRALPRSPGCGVRPRAGRSGRPPAVGPPAAGPGWPPRCAPRRPWRSAPPRPTPTCCPAPSSRWHTPRSARHRHGIMAHPGRPGPGRGGPSGPVRPGCLPRGRTARRTPAGPPDTAASRARATGRRGPARNPRPRASQAASGPARARPGSRPALSGGHRSRAGHAAQMMTRAGPPAAGRCIRDGPASLWPRAAAAETKMRPKRSSQIACDVDNLRI